MEALRKMQAELQRTLHWLVLATVVLWAVVIGLGITGYLVNSHRADDATRAAALALRALCSQRANYDEQIQNSAQFLREHPHGLGAITPAIIRRSLSLTEAARAALADVECPPPIAKEAR